MKTDFLVITALPEEREAVLAQLAGCATVSQTVGSSLVYFTAEIVASSQRNPYHLTVLCLPGMGRVNAASATSEAINQWHPEYVVLVGIAGGIGEQGVSLGDVLVSNQVVDYELQKLGTGRVDVRPSYPPISHRLLNAALNFRDQTWTDSVKSRPSPGKPEVHFGPIASGDKVINDPEALRRLISLSSKLIGVEMEAGGAGTASHHAETNFFMVRGVSDLADGQKDTFAVGQWRPYACDVAAAYGIGLVRSGLLAAPGPRELRTNYGEVSKAVASAARSIVMVDKLAGPIESLLTGSTDTTWNRRMRYEGAGIELVSKEHGKVVQTITGQDLQKLPVEDLRHIRVREKKLENHYAVWEEVHPQLALMVDPIAKARVNQQLRQIVSEMKEELGAIFEFLAMCGLALDDHYSRFRDVIRDRA